MRGSDPRQRLRYRISILCKLGEYIWKETSYRGFCLPLETTCGLGLKSHRLDFPTPVDFREMLHFCVIPSDMMYSGLDRRVLDVVFQYRVTDVFLCPDWEWVECCGQQACTDVVS